MIVQVTQFIRPNGRQEPYTTEVSDECAVGYETMQRNKCRLTAEIIFGDMVSLCIEHEFGDYRMRLMPNGPQVQAELTDMLKSFDEAEFDRWLEDQ